MQYQIAVRALAEFTAKQGDLDLRFSPAPSAQEGIAGHAFVTARRPAGYQTEVSLSGDYQHLAVRGRADGYDPERRQIEEIKTYRGDLDRMPANHRYLHWAQAKIYGWLMCRKLGLAEIRVALVYFEIGRLSETVLVEVHSADALRQFFEQQCACFLDWAGQELAHRGARDTALRSLPFPHASFRAGQRQLSAAVFHGARLGRCLLAEAPTGIGKTVGTLFPLLKATPSEALDKIFFLAAKTPGRALALTALENIRSSAASLPLRVLELVARDKACEHPDKACHGESCPLAQGFYDRLPQARSAALARQVLDQATVRAVALEHQVCPYYLSQELARWCDVMVGDYNYYFDVNALLHGLTNANQWRVGVLVDEAHNLIERARGMYSAELDQRKLDSVRQTAPAFLKTSLERLNRSWNAAAKEQDAPYAILEQAPPKVAAALQQAVAAFSAFYADNPSHADANLQRFYFDALHFTRLLESFGPHSLFDISRDINRNISQYAPASGRRVRSTLGIRNVIPAPFLAPRFALARSCVLFSGTLSPWHYYSDTLGLPPDVAWVEAESPFNAQQLAVHVSGAISTRFRDRAHSLGAIVALIARQYRQRRGNYLAFFSSFDYLRQAADALRASAPDIPIWEQSRGMDESERTHFLSRFASGGSGIGFAVLGGAFAEGVDLPGERLVGAFIATLGLPQINPLNEEIKQRMGAAFGAGYDYAYLFPGLRKVVQAAGRVIRSPEDRGIVYLMDDRFARPEVQRLLPTWWKLEQT